MLNYNDIIRQFT